MIIEGVAARAKQGNASSDNAAQLGRLTTLFARRAVETLEGRPATGGFLDA